MKTVFTNGCFDILHRGHFELFKFCRELAPTTKVVVGLNSDRSVKELKGNDRPYNNQDDRMFALQSIKYIDEVIIFDSITPYQLIKEIQPDVLVKGGDYTIENVVGRDLVQETVLFNFIHGYSTTKILTHGNNL